jgi:ferritin-like metal-binding protein YciE
MGKVAREVRDDTYHSLLADLSTQERAVIEALRKCGRSGATRHELARLLNRPLSSMCGRVNRLEENSIVIETGDKRETEFGKLASVVRLADRYLSDAVVQQQLF